MDIIDNFNRLTLGMYQEIQEISRNESLEDIDRQVQILSVLTGVAEEEILSITNLMDLTLSKLWETVKDRQAWCTAVHGTAKSWT